MGANGAGKTTLFSLIAGHVRPDSGQILLRGESLVDRRPDQVCRQGVARTFQIVRPFGGLSAFENVVTAAMFGSHASPRRREAEAVAHEALGDVGLGPHTDVLAADLTLSQQKRLEVARALATGAGVLLLDEVMAGLTPTEVAQMLSAIAQMRQKRKLTILIIEHVMQALMHLSDKIVVLHLGKKVVEGTPKRIRADADVQLIYFGKAG
jgi:branched-chain amino acid transport system ATP-binding protein